MHPKHILIYCPVFLPQQSGYVHAFVQLIQTLLNQNIQVDVLTPQLLPANEHEPLQHPLLHIHRYHPVLKIWALGLFYEYGKLAGRINALDNIHHYDMILVETGDSPLLIASLNQQVLQKTVVRFHSTSDTEYLLFGKHKKYKLRRFFWKYLAANHVKHLSATNSYHLKFAHQHILHASKVKSAVVLTNIIHPPEQQQHIHHKELQFFMLGRMDEEGYKQKGFAQLLEALPLVEKHFNQTGAKLTIVGNGKLYGHFSTQIQRFAFVELHKEWSHQEVLNKLDHADVVLLPSLYEGVSMFALEALSRGNAVIFSNTGGLVPMVSDNGMLIEPGNSTELAQAMIELLEAKNLEQQKRKSVQIAIEQYNSNIQFQQFLSLYRAIQQ